MNVNNSNKETLNKDESIDKTTKRNRFMRTATI
jgi:hypothetical protein